MATTTKVVDASALAAIIFDEPAGQEAAALLLGAHLIAPTLLSYEISNICATKMRREPERESKIMQAFTYFESLEVRQLTVRFADCLLLARSRRLSAYDASYLLLARTLGLELVTLDGKLGRAAKAFS